uniref:Putative secreted protein n=1 Tax=Ixodes ricinus TaxID=34613 RepID=A0A147BJZ0_IXORI
MKRPTWFAIPMNCLTSVTVVGAGILEMAVTLCGSGLIPSWLTMCPKNFMDFFLNSHLSLSRTPAAFNLLRTSSSLSSCSFSLAPVIRMSSIWHRTPGIPSRISFILR